MIVSLDPSFVSRDYHDMEYYLNTPPLGFNNLDDIFMKTVETVSDAFSEIRKYIAINHISSPNTYLIKLTPEEGFEDTIIIAVVQDCCTFTIRFNSQPKFININCERLPRVDTPKGRQPYEIEYANYLRQRDSFIEDDYPKDDLDFDINMEEE